MSDVAGIDHIKQEFLDIIEFLRNPEEYSKRGARPPKGVLLEGGPGLGKTLIAKAVAGEAGVPFYQMGGSEFVEIIVGERYTLLYLYLSNCFNYIYHLQYISKDSYFDDRPNNRPMKIRLICKIYVFIGSEFNIKKYKIVCIIALFNLRFH